MEPALISRLQVRQPPAQRDRLDALTTRLRVGSLLEQLDFSRIGLGPAAVLCIRSLEDPLPGTLLLQNGALSPAWEDAVRRSLEEQARRAVRPAREMVPAGANAVLFTDQAELLACLAADWCRGECAQHWWWQSWLRAGDAQAAVLAAWISSPEYIPGAFIHLERLHRTRAGPISAQDFVNRAGPVAARELLNAVLPVFGLPELLRLFSANPVANQPSPAHDPALSQQPIEEFVDADRPRPEPPWLAYLQPGGAAAVHQNHSGLADPICQALVGTSLALIENPTLVRTQAFLQQASVWWAWANEHNRAVDPQARIEEDGAVSAPGMPPGSGEIRSPGLPWAEIANDPARTENEQAPGSSLDSRRVWGEESHPETPPHAMAPLLAGLGEEMVVQTELGGLFYLVNLGLYLGLYADFSSPGTPGLDLNIWDFVSLVGQALPNKALVGAAGLRSDPIWGLLAQLAGRGNADAPGVGFAPPDAWRIPPGWLTALAPAAGRIARRPWRWTVMADRLRIEHPLGFAVLDLPLEGHSPAQVLDRERRISSSGWGANEFRLQKANPRKSVVAGPAFTGLPAALTRWLGWVTGYVRARLDLALGPGFGGSPRTSRAQRLLVTPARLRVTTTHVEVHLSLERLPVEIRLAGLDRDPGWVPAAGRFIRFVFA